MTVQCPGSYQIRRKDKAITNQEQIIDVVKSSKICRLALADENIPYIVPVNYGYKDNTLYIHSAKSGRKIDLLKKNNLVCFEVESDVQIMPSDTSCRWTTQFKCVVGYGKAELLSDRESIIQALDIIMEHQSGKSGWTYNDRELSRVVIIKVVIDSMTGKRSI